MGTMYMNSKNRKTSDPHRLLISLIDKINSKRSDKYVALSNLSIYYTWKNIATINLKYQLQHGTKNMNYLKDHILYQILKIIILNIHKNTWRKDYEYFNKNIYINKIGNRITFKIKTGYYRILTLHCNIVNNNYQQNSRVLYTFVPNK